MSRIVSGWVVSRNPASHDTPWQAWRSGRTRLNADTYRGLLALIREENAS